MLGGEFGAFEADDLAADEGFGPENRYGHNRHSQN